MNLTRFTQDKLCIYCFQTFESNLEEEGLQIERKYVQETGLHFVKIYAPIEVLKRYAEILKLRLPMRQVSNVK